MPQKVFKYNNVWDIVERDSGFWLVDAIGPISGPFGSMTEAAEWAATHSEKEFQTKSFYKRTK